MISFNGATSSRTWKGRCFVSICGSFCKLQWSHVLTNVESHTVLVNTVFYAGFNGATSSRTWKADTGIIVRSTFTCFNGATSSRTWKGGHGLADAPERLGLQWSHVLTNVERPAGQKKMQEEKSFNGATSSRTWKGLTRQCCCQFLTASMEPRPHERGKLPAIPSPPALNRASMEPRPHERGKRIKSLRRRNGHHRFNGATSSRTWKARLWICGYSDRNRASMEPRPHERGKRSSKQPASPTPERFNGATSSRTWKALRLIPGFGRKTSLQWSHVLTNVER